MAIRKISVGKELAAGSNTIMYEVPAGYRASWGLLYMINNTASSKTFTVEWRDASNNLICHVFFNYPISAKNFIMFDSGQWVMLEEGHTIHIIAEAGSDADAIVSLELERNNT